MHLCNEVCEEQWRLKVQHRQYIASAIGLATAETEPHYIWYPDLC